MFPASACVGSPFPAAVDLYSCAFRDFDLDLFNDGTGFQCSGAADHGTIFNDYSPDRSEHEITFLDASSDKSERGDIFDTSLNKTREYGSLYGATSPDRTNSNFDLPTQGDDHFFGTACEGSSPPYDDVSVQHHPTACNDNYHTQSYHEEIMRTGMADSTHYPRLQEDYLSGLGPPPLARGVAGGPSVAPFGRSCPPPSPPHGQKIKMYEWFPQVDPALEQKRMRALRARLNRERHSQRKDCLRETLGDVQEQLSSLKAEKARRQRRIAVMEAHLAMMSITSQTHNQN